MSTIDITLPENLTTYLREEATRRGYRDVSEFVQSLLEAEKLRNIRRELEQSLDDALDSPSTPLTDADFDEIEQEGNAILRKRRNR